MSQEWKNTDSKAPSASNYGQPTPSPSSDKQVVCIDHGWYRSDGVACPECQPSPSDEDAVKVVADAITDGDSADEQARIAVAALRGAGWGENVWVVQAQLNVARSLLTRLEEALIRWQTWDETDLSKLPEVHESTRAALAAVAQARKEQGW